MQTLRLTTGAAALAVGSMAIFSAAAPALADHKAGHPKPPGQAGSNCPNPAGKYPPGQCKKAGVSDTNSQRGQQMSATTQDGEFTPGEDIEFGVQSVYQKLGETEASSDGSATATFTVPSNLSNGAHNVIFTSLETGKRVSVPFTVRGGAAGGNSGRGSQAGGTPSSLPFTGSDDLVPLTLVGVALLTAGTGAVVAARRRRSDDMGSSNAA